MCTLNFKLKTVFPRASSRALSIARIHYQVFLVAGEGNGEENVNVIFVNKEKEVRYSGYRTGN